ncbi:MAG: hypothetical protein DBX55_04225 [Verrucomicrobia bacterium]|nr:MAG: hypothetical protein DBX55_04225 [Verrucomicrobiota bacterium]
MCEISESRGIFLAVAAHCGKGFGLGKIFSRAPEINRGPECLSGSEKGCGKIRRTIAQIERPAVLQNVPRACAKNRPHILVPPSNQIGLKSVCPQCFRRKALASAGVFANAKRSALFSEMKLRDAFFNGKPAIGMRV